MRLSWQSVWFDLDEEQLSSILEHVGSMEFEFEGAVVEWRGPAPFYFVAIPKEESSEIKVVAKGVEYWGQVPVTVRISDIKFSTALFPKDGRYLLPLKEQSGSQQGSP